MKGSSQPDDDRKFMIISDLETTAADVVSEDLSYGSFLLKVSAALATVCVGVIGMSLFSRNRA